MESQEPWAGINIESLKAIASIVSAFGTVLIAVVAQLYSMRQSAILEVEERKRALKTVCDDINAREAVLLMMNQRVEIQGTSHYLSGREWNNAWDPDCSYADQKPLAARMVFSDFIDAVRASAEVFDEILKSSSAKKIWRGRYDHKTRNIRLATKAFHRFFTSTYDGVAEKRQKYIQKEVGNEKDWGQIMSMFARIDPDFHPSDFVWILDLPAHPMQESTESADERAELIQPLVQ
mmetsp:Transcript_58487/g.126532  ORF Transcript_58487/g.126532 Transcript_58487/m.126532 type:complete len:235 (+) Transcript_58487:98-802(+)